MSEHDAATSRRHLEDKEVLAKECIRLESELAQARAECMDLRDVLLRNGFVPCDIPACNCGSWHGRYGLFERWQEITDALRNADVLNNETGNKPLNAINKLIGETERLRAEVEALKERLRVRKMTRPEYPIAQDDDAARAKP